MWPVMACLSMGVVIRMRWARVVAREASEEPAPEPGADANARAWRMTMLHLRAVSRPRAGR